jgi:AcrR family transcriptional regulator
MADQTRREILEVARRLFAARGYAATSIGDVAAEAGVAVQTIYSRLGSKRGMLVALATEIDEDVGAAEPATTAGDALAAAIRRARTLEERSGDVIGSLAVAAGAEPELDALAGAVRARHRRAAGAAAERIGALGGLRAGIEPAEAAALIALSTSHEAWDELVRAGGMGWDAAEALVADALARALLRKGARRA